MGSQARATAAGKGHADNPVDGCAYFSYRIEFVFDDPGVRVQGLEEITVQAPKVARDSFLVLDLLNAIDRSCLISYYAGAISSPRSLIISMVRSSQSGARWAVVRAVMPPGIGPRSRMIIFCPLVASS
jgi:hypothetical protein